MCLESKDYTQIRNTIMVLTKVRVGRGFEKGACLLFFSEVVELLRVEQ